MKSTQNLKNLIEVGSLGINPDTTVTLKYTYGEDVAHYNDDYQEGVFQNSGLGDMITGMIYSGVDANILDNKFSNAVEESEYVNRDGSLFDSEGNEYDFSDAVYHLGLMKDTDDTFDEEHAWQEVRKAMTFVPDDITEAITYDSWEFGIDTSLEQYDYKRGFYEIELEIETTAAALIESTYDFSDFKISLDTEVATITLK